MVLKIAEYLLEPRGETVQEHADAILRMIERNGMKPPEAEYKTSFIGNHIISYLRQWEDEDEAL